MRGLVSVAALCALWLGGVDSAAAQACADNSQCPQGSICGAQGVCVQGGSVTVQGSAGGGTVQGQVTVQPQPVPPPPQQQQVYVQPQPQPQPIYQQPQPAPRQARVEERPIWGLIIPGIAMLAAGYVVNIFVSLIGAIVIGFDSAVSGSSGTTADAFFYTGLIPVAGPFVQMAITEGDENWLPYLLVDGLIQTAGLTMIILGAVLRQSVETYAGIELDDDVTLTIAPMPTQGGMGLQTALSF